MYDAKQLGKAWERVMGPDADEYLEYVAKASVSGKASILTGCERPYLDPAIGILEDSQVVFFDDTALHPPPIPRTDVFYVRRSFNIDKDCLEVVWVHLRLPLSILMVLM